MGQNKEQLNKLLDFIDELAKDKENAWFVGKLRDRYGQTSDGRIDDIYEHCIVQIAREQAEQFYKDFPIKDLVPGLTEDFIRMEIFRRRNAFDDFSLAVYQQIERITNYISQISQLNDAIYKLMGHSAYIVSKQNPDGTRNDAINDRMPSSYQIAKLLFGKDAFQKSNCYLRDQYAVDKIVCILYFVCYKCKLKSHL